MAKDISINIEGDADLLFANGDFKISESDQQDVVLIINTHVGHWKGSPTIGVGIKQYLASSGKGAELKRSIAVQLAADNFKVNSVNLTEGADGFFEYDIDAERL